MQLNYTKEELQQYWVGLMDGAGSIQVNHWRSQVLQYRLVIKLKSTEANEQMLKLLSTAVGGSVVREKKEGSTVFVKWIMSDMGNIKETIKIWKKYPPLTTRLQLQLRFMQECFEHKSITIYFETRDKKYDTRPEIIAEWQNPKEKGEKHLPNYFEVWLAGFTEAEGRFLYRAGQKRVGFSISQKNDKYLIEAIREKLGIVETQVPVQSQDQWTIETQLTGTVKKIMEYYDRVPLLGEKKVDLSRAKSRIADK